MSEWRNEYPRSEGYYWSRRIGDEQRAWIEWIARSTEPYTGVLQEWYQEKISEPPA